MDFNKEKFLEQFKKYVSKYDLNDKNIMMKYNHSIRVMNLAFEIAKSLNLDDNDIETCTVAGLLHDYARFYQWTNFHTFSDVKSIDHGDLAVEFLFSNNEIETFYTKKDNYDKIYNSIKYHNKKEINKDLDQKNILISKIIRDADKIDIFYVLSNDKDYFLESSSEITKEISKEFFEHKNIDYHDIKNNNDRILLLLTMLYDINFEYSYKYILENNMLENMLNNIEDKNKFKKYFDFIDEYLKNKIKEI